MAALYCLWPTLLWVKGHSSLTIAVGFDSRHRPRSRVTEVVGGVRWAVMGRGSRQSQVVLLGGETPRLGST